MYIANSSKPNVKIIMLVNHKFNQINILAKGVQEFQVKVIQYSFFLSKKVEDCLFMS